MRSHDKNAQQELRVVVSEQSRARASEGCVMAGGCCCRRHRASIGGCSLLSQSQYSGFHGLHNCPRGTLKTFLLSSACTVQGTGCLRLNGRERCEDKGANLLLHNRDACLFAASSAPLVERRCKLKFDQMLKCCG